MVVDLRALGGEMEGLGREKDEEVEEERWRVSCMVISHGLFFGKMEKWW